MYIQIERENIWQVYTTEIAKDGLLRGGGNTSSAKMFKSNNGEESVRPADFKIVFDAPSGEHFVYPDLTKGLSFSSNLQRLRDIPIPVASGCCPVTESCPRAWSSTTRLSIIPC